MKKKSNNEDKSAFVGTTALFSKIITVKSFNFKNAMPVSFGQNCSHL